MSSKKRERRAGAPPCDAVGADDGIDPRVLFRGASPRRDDKHVLRLCSQVRDILSLAFAECRDDVLQSLYVASVAPAPDATRLAVSVVPAVGTAAADVQARIAAVTGALRAEVAASVHRRRAPELVFRVVAPGEGAP